MMKVAVVILNFNGKELLQKFLPSVVRFSPSAKIILADNHSADGSVEMVRKEFPLIEIISIPENRGFCGGYNYALQKIEAEYYVLLNSDVEVTTGWIEPIIELFERDKTIGAVQPKILSYHHKNQFEYAGAGGGFIDTLGYPFCRGRIFNALEEDQGQFNDTLPVFWASGACLFIRSSLFHNAGRLDEDFFAHMEEIDLCWRLQKLGFKIYFQGNSTVYHVGGGTLSTSSPKKTYFNFKNGLSLILKNMSGSELVYKLPLRILLDWVAAVKFLLQGSGKDSLAVMKAHVNFLKGIRKDFAKRDRNVPKALPIYHRSIAFDHFVLRKNKFGDLRFNNPK